MGDVEGTVLGRELGAAVGWLVGICWREGAIVGNVAVVEVSGNPVAVVSVAESVGVGVAKSVGVGVGMTASVVSGTDVTVAIVCVNDIGVNVGIVEEDVHCTSGHTLQ